MTRDVLSVLARTVPPGGAAVLIAAGAASLATSLAGRAGATAMTPHAALAFVLLGTALLASRRDRGALAAVAAAAAVSLSGVDLYLQLYAPGGAAAWPHMSPNSATAVLLAGAGLLILLASRGAAATSAAALLGSLVMALGLAALLSHLLHLWSQPRAAGLPHMSLSSAGCFVILGAAVVTKGIRRSGIRAWHELPWLATSGGAATSLLSVLLWRALAASPQSRAEESALLPDAVLLLGLSVSALLSAALAQARHLRRRSVQLAQANAALAVRAEDIRDLFDYAPCGYHSLDSEGIVVQINQTELDWLGYRREELVGRKRLSDLLTPAGLETFRRNFPEFKRSGALHDLELELVRKDGSRLWVLVNATAIYDRDGRYLKSRSTVYDITEFKRLEHERQQAAERLRTLGEEVQDLYDHAPCGYHTLDIEGRLLRINDTELAWLGYTRSQLLQNKRFCELLTPDSAVRFERQQAELIDQGQTTDQDYEMIRADGSLLPVTLSMTATRGSDGAFAGARATVHDITHRVQAERTLRESQGQLQRLLDHLRAAVAVFDSDGRLRYANPTAARLAGQPLESLVGRRLHELPLQLLHDDGTPITLDECLVAQTLRHHILIEDQVIGIKDPKGGEVRWILASSSPELADQDDLRQVVLSFVDISERRRLERELEFRMQTDVLTGLATRRHFMQLAENELKRVRRHGSPLSLLMVDVDHFKSINDLYGHQAGDAALAAIGATMRNTLRGDDVAGRLGGEEFAVLLPGIRQAHAVEAAERLRAAVEAQEIALPGGPPALRLTVSVGVAECPDTDPDLPDLMRRADEAMYECKRAGRNRVIGAAVPAPPRRVSRPPA